jgi:hypothetical protein
MFNHPSGCNIFYKAWYCICSHAMISYQDRRVANKQLRRFDMRILSRFEVARRSQDKNIISKTTGTQTMSRHRAKQNTKGPENPYMLQLIHLSSALFETYRMIECGDLSRFFAVICRRQSRTRCNIGCHK